jgi:uncharacterized protein YegP (UPF0339 family)
MAGRFVLKRGAATHCFALKAGNGETISTNDHSSQKAPAATRITSVMANAINTDRYLKKQSENKHCMFNRITTSGRVLVASAIYSTTTARDKRFASVRVSAVPHAK